MKISSISSLFEYVELLSSSLQLGNEYIFRGQSDNTWSVTCSAARRLNESCPLTVPAKDFIKHHQKILREFRRRKFDVTSNGEKLSELELLGEIQHFEGSTGLLDFTVNSLVALWFACDSYESKTGVVFVYNLTEHADAIVEMEPEYFGASIHELLEFDVEGLKILKSEARIAGSQLQNRMNEAPKMWRWIPISTTNKRMFAQSSCFLFGQPGIRNEEFDLCIYIEGDRKKHVLDELELLFSMDAARMFSDLAGYAQHGCYYSASCNSKLRDAFRSFRGLRHEDAIEDFTGVINTPEVSVNAMSHAYFRRGLIHYLRKDFEVALADFSTLIEDVADCPQKIRANAYGNRGAIYNELSEVEKAISDFSVIIDDDDNPDDLRMRAYYYRACCLEKVQPPTYGEVINDFTQVVESSADIPSDLKASAFINRAGCWEHTDLPASERWKRKKSDYRSVIDMDNAPADLRQAAEENL